MTVEVDRARVWMYSLCVYNLRCENEGTTTDVGIRLARWSVHQPHLILFLASACRPKEVLVEFIEAEASTHVHVQSICSYGS
jgi:hypothetical protein